VISVKEKAPEVVVTSKTSFPENHQAFKAGYRVIVIDSISRGLRHMIDSYSFHMNGFPRSYGLVSPRSYLCILICCVGGLLFLSLRASY